MQVKTSRRPVLREPPARDCGLPRGCSPYSDQQGGAGKHLTRTHVLPVFMVPAREEEGKGVTGSNLRESALQGTKQGEA